MPTYAAIPLGAPVWYDFPGFPEALRCCQCPKTAALVAVTSGSLLQRVLCKDCRGSLPPGMNVASEAPLSYRKGYSITPTVYYHDWSLRLTYHRFDQDREIDQMPGMVEAFVERLRSQAET